MDPNKKVCSSSSSSYYHYYCSLCFIGFDLFLFILPSFPNSYAIAPSVKFASTFCHLQFLC
jgi:hypothetical protein